MEKEDFKALCDYVKSMRRIVVMDNMSVEERLEALRAIIELLYVHLELSES